MYVCVYVCVRVRRLEWRWANGRRLPKVDRPPTYPSLDASFLESKCRNSLSYRTYYVCTYVCMIEKTEYSIWYFWFTVCRLLYVELRNRKPVYQVRTLLYSRAILEIIITCHDLLFGNLLYIGTSIEFDKKLCLSIKASCPTQLPLVMMYVCMYVCMTILCSRP